MPVGPYQIVSAAWMAAVASALPALPVGAFFFEHRCRYDRAGSSSQYLERVSQASTNPSHRRLELEEIIDSINESCANQ